MTIKNYKPSSSLAHFVESYWIARWDAADEQPQTEITTSTNVHVLITTVDAAIIGMATHGSIYALSGDGVAVGITFKAGGFYPFFKKPIDRLTNQRIPLRTIYSVTRIKRLTANFDKNDTEIVTNIEKLLRSKRPEQDVNIDALEVVIKDIKENESLDSVEAVCDKYELSERTLQRTFQQYVGIGVKWMTTHKQDL